jgi:regulatory protein
MDSLEPERSSSSPSVRISELKAEGTGGSVLRVRLDNGSLFLLDADLPALPRYHSGDLVNDEDLRLLSAASETYSCRQKALDLIGRSEQYRHGLYAKLVSRGFSREAVTAALDRLEAAGSLSDRRYAEVWVRSRLRTRPEGPVRLKAALAAKGISSSVAARAVDSVLEELDDQDSEKSLRRAWEKLSRRSGITEAKMIKALAARGFSLSKTARFLRNTDGKNGGDN